MSHFLPNPFVSSEVETPIVRARHWGLSTSLEANGFMVFSYEQDRRATALHGRYAACDVSLSPAMMRPRGSTFLANLNRYLSGESRCWYNRLAYERPRSTLLSRPGIAATRPTGMRCAVL